MKEFIKKILRTCGLVLLWLVIFDAGSQIIIKILDNDKINSFFSYGLSTERQIRDMFKEEIPMNSVLHAGWISEDKFRERGTEVDITFYGMSFSNHIADQLMEIDQDLVVRKIDGPAAPLNHSLSSFLVDKDICDSGIVVLGVLDSALKYIESMTNDTIGGDTPMGSFYPRFVETPEGLEQVFPGINSFEQLEVALLDESLWRKNLELLRNYDNSYSPWIYRRNVLDYSITGRFIKRWYKSKHNEIITKKAYNNRKFNEIVILQAEGLIRIFVEEAKKSGFVPVIILIETQLYGDALNESLRLFLEELGTDYLSTGDIVSTTNPADYMADGHITEENNRKIALALDNLIMEKGLKNE